MPFLEKDDVKIHYETFGAGEGHWVTLVAAYARPLTDLGGMARSLAERGARVLAFDNRGAGKAECPPSFTLADIAGDIVALWDHLSIARSHLVGMGYGGAIAATLAASHPDRVTGLVLVGTPVDAKALAVETRPPPRDPKRFMGGVARYFSPAFVRSSPAIVQGYARQMARTFQEPDTALGAACQRDSMAEMDLVPLLPAIRTPALVVYGTEDKLVDPASAKALAAGIAGARLEPVDGVGHLLLAEAPRKLYDIVDGFCRDTVKR